jgi:DNA polymerase III epsilon subunit-like protein
MRQHGLTKNGELIVLQRFHGGVRSTSVEPDEPRASVLVVDVETTGLDPGIDPIIELAAARIEVATESGQIAAHERTVSWLEDPGRPLPPEIVRLTGLSDADLRGERIPDDAARGLFEGVSLILAHNARFDRAMCVARFPWLADPTAPAWGCSLEQIDWKGYGHKHADLQSLAKDHGFFYDAHRATIDVEATIKLLSCCGLGHALRCAHRSQAPGVPLGRGGQALAHAPARGASGGGARVDRRALRALRQRPGTRFADPVPAPLRQRVGAALGASLTLPS